MKITPSRQILSAITAVGVLAVLGCGVACAAVLATASAGPDAPVDASDVNVSDTAADLSKSSLSIPLYNNSSYTMVVQSVSGDSAGVPELGTVLLSGKGSQDYEVVFRAAKTTTVTAQYQLQNPAGDTMGTGTIKLSVNAVGSRSVSSSYTSGVGLKTEYVGNGAWEVEDSAAVTHTLDATDPQAATVVQQFCNDANNSAVCKFDSARKTSTTQQKLLVSGYTQTGGDGEPSEISVSSGYESQATVTTGTAVSASLKLGGILTVGVKQGQDEELEFATVFTAADNLDVDPGDTGYIWGAVPVNLYSGTMTVDVGNTTWVINNFTVTSPDPKTPLSKFVSGTFHGYYPIGHPDQPPAA